MRSDELKNGSARAPARAMLKGAGFSDADLEARRREPPPAPRRSRYTRGVMAKYAALVSSASEGAVTRAERDPDGGDLP